MISSLVLLQYRLKPSSNCCFRVMSCFTNHIAARYNEQGTNDLNKLFPIDTKRPGCLLSPPKTAKLTPHNFGFVVVHVTRSFFPTSFQHSLVWNSVINLLLYNTRLWFIRHITHRHSLATHSILDFQSFTAVLLTLLFE